MIVAKCWVVCPCGKKHRLYRGKRAPWYRCGDIMKDLKGGAMIEYEEVKHK